MRGSVDLIFKDEAYAIIGACFEVYNEMGSGFAEAVYQECLGLEFEDRAIPYEAEVDLRICYKGKEISKRYQPDFVCHQKIIVELKAVSNLTSNHRAQLLNYLKATNFKLGILVNFGSANQMEWQRLVR